MARFQFKNRKNNGLIFFISFMVMGEAAIAAPLPQWANAPAVTPVAQLSLQESILRAFARNPGVTQQAAQIGIGEAQIDEAKSAWYPHVGLTGNAGPSRQTDSSGRLDNNVSYGITLTQLVYDFGKTNNDINLQTAARDSYRFKLMATLTDVAEKRRLPTWKSVVIRLCAMRLNAIFTRWKTSTTWRHCALTQA